MQIKKFVISAVNLTEAGGLSILKQAIISASNTFPKNWLIIAIVNSSNELPKYKNIFYIEIKSAKKRWLLRLYWEYIGFYFMSLNIKPDIWLSLHDITPNVKSKYRAVYCHNPSPFYDSNLRTLILDYKFYLFSKFYKILYNINIKNNDLVIVQQEWLKNKFINIFNIDNVIVSKPEILYKINDNKQSVIKNKNSKLLFLYPAFPRIFKNFEVIFKAIKLLDDNELNKIIVMLTISPNMNPYTKYLYKNYGNGGVEWIGVQDQDAMQQLYDNVDVILFPSKLETWGLPISEAIANGKYIIAADEGYAHETALDYVLIDYINANDPHAWANSIKRVINELPYQDKTVLNNYKDEWNTLWYKIINNYKKNHL
jgi:glycosyltransferase involved in cell wall biosynthesis